MTTRIDRSQRSLCRFAVPLAALGILVGSSAAIANQTGAGDGHGARLYADLCASCHGDSGQGVQGSYDLPLSGDHSIRELAALIAGTMPEGEPAACDGEDAEAVARYIFDAFYSEAAQLRNVPPRAALARLTAQQYRQSISDLFAHFMGRPQWKDERGLTANYFAHPGWKNDKKVDTRTDPNIDVDYGQESPGEGMEDTKFAVYWSGALSVPQTGSYTITARGKGSFIVKFIDKDEKFFDNHVFSGDMAEHSATVQLVGGRLYPISVDLIKRERKTGNVDISLTLAWKTPGGVEEPIPTRHLLPGWFPTAFAPQTPLPPDDRSAGYERGNTISRQWDEATTTAALEFADVVVNRIWPKYRQDAKKDKKNELDDEQLLERFCSELVELALRRPLDEATGAVYVQTPLAEAPNVAEGLRRVTVLALKSPWFLYPMVDVQADPSWQRASRLALTLWDSLPDGPLRQAASEGQLADEAQLRQRAAQMLDDPRARAKALSGLHQWLDLDRWDEISKHADLFPGFDDALVADLRASLDLFLEAVLWSETSDFRQLLEADWSFTSERIAGFYGASWKPTGDDAIGRFSRTESAPEVRAGVITHPLLMSALAYGDVSSPIFRGVFLLRHVLGRMIRPPNEAFTPLAAELHPELTTRQRVTLQTSPPACQGCHQRINGLGFTLEAFDAVGRPRSEERSQPIDASGHYIDRAGREIELDGARHLSGYLADSDDATDAFINRMFLHFVKHPVGAYGENRMKQLKTRFRESGYNMRELLVEIAVIAAAGPAAAPEA